MSARSRSALPGFGLSLGITLLWLTLLVIIPLAALVLRSAGAGWAHFAEAAFSERALAAYRVTFLAALLATLINAVFGLIIAWVLVRIEFPGRRLLSSVIDLPFALPTAVAGIALTALYANTGWIGAILAPFGIQIAYQPQGILIALIFIGLPFIVRSIEPVLADLDVTFEEAARTLGAKPWQVFCYVIVPAIAPALLTGCALAFARCVGEYGSVIFIAGNVPKVSEIAPLLIFSRLEQYDYAGASAIAVVMLLMSFAVLIALSLYQGFLRRRMGL
jgi:sulfate/thiosulfate transport system permease protein